MTTVGQTHPHIRLAIVSDNILVRVGLRRIFDEDRGVVVVGESDGGVSACNLVARERPDVIVMDIGSDMKPAEVISSFRQKAPGSRIIVLSGWDEMDRARQALASGADDVVMKCQQPGVLLSTVECFGKGLATVLKAKPSDVPMTDTKDKKRTDRALVVSTRCTSSLTDRERGIISLLGKGLSNRDIASQLCISETTVRHHLTSIFDKLGVSNRQKLLICAHQYGLVELTASA